MDMNMLIVVVGILLMPALVIGIAKRLHKIKTGEVGENPKVNLNSIFKVSLLICFICILFGVVWGTISNF